MASMLDETIKQQVRELLAEMQHPVEIIFFGSADEATCQYCAETQQLLEEVSSLSDLIFFSSHDIDGSAALARQYKVDAAPGFVLVSRDGEQVLDYGVRFKGIPAGHEFTSLINDLLLVSRRESGLSQEAKDFLRQLDQPVHLQVFVTPTCPYCPRAVVMAHQFAMESPMIEAEMVEATEFPELSARFNVSGVPQTTINMGAGTMVGAGSEQHLIAEITAALEKSAVK